MAKPFLADPDAFMQLARERFTLCTDADKMDRTEAEEDVDFVAGAQWAERARKRREKFHRPVMTENRLPTFVAQIVNSGRENKPSIRVSAMDGGKVATAEFFQSRIRHIEYEADADIAYDTSREHQVVSGRGFLRVGTEYKPGSMDQRITIDPVENQFSVLFDPSARKYDRSDAGYCFVFSWLAKEAYERAYGRATAAAAQSYFETDDLNPAPGWINIGPNGDFIQVAEYWLKEYRKRELCLLEDLTCKYRDELTGQEKSPVMDSRDDDFCTVTQYIIDGVEPLDSTEFLIPLIPIVPVWGKQMMVGGQRRNYSLVRFAKDPQRLVNLYVSNIAEQVAQMPKTPYIGADTQFLGLEQEWKEINEDPKAFVRYKPTNVNGNPLPPPQRVVNEPPIQALTLGLNQAIDAMKAAMGIFDASLGAGPGDTAGIAIQKRQKESDVANFHFPDNEARSRKYVGRILLKLIPILDKGPRTVPVRSDAGKTSLVRVNDRTKDEKTGQFIVHNLAQGNYEPAISTGPSYDSQREQANDAYAAIARADKNFMTFAGDLYFRTSDMPGAQEIADRYERMLPPALRPASQNQAAQNQKAIQQLAQQHAQQTQLIHNLSQIIETRQVECSSRERIAALQASSAERVALIAAQSKIGISMAEAEAERLENMFDRAHDAGMAAVGQNFDADAQAGDQAHAQQMQADAQQHQTGLQSSAQDAAASQQAQAAATAAAQQQPA